MPRKPRIHFPGALSHVIARGNRREKIFRSNKDYQLSLTFLSEYKARYGFSLYAYALMPTHIHLLLKVGELPLSRIMQTLQFRYTRNFNINYKNYGHLFKGRCKALVCEKDTYCLELSASIHLNPVRAGLVNDPIKYPWCSYQAYLSKEKDNLVEKDFILAQFSHKKSVALKEYEGFVKGHSGQGHREDFYGVKDQRFLGEDTFVEHVHRRVNENPPFVYTISLGEIVSEVSSSLHIAPDLFYTPTRNRQGALGRSLVGYLGRKLGSHQIKETADHFHRDPVVMSQGIKRLETTLKEKKEFVTTVSDVEQSLIRKSGRRILN